MIDRIVTAGETCGKCTLQLFGKTEQLKRRLKRMKKVKIECDLAMKERIKTVFAEESERCFFGHGPVRCEDYMTPDGPNCARCIEENVEWTGELDE